MNERTTGSCMGVIEFNSIPDGLKSINEVIKNVNLESVEHIYLSDARLVGLFFGTYGEVSCALELSIDISSQIIDLTVLGVIHPHLQEVLTEQVGYQNRVIHNILVLEMKSFAMTLEITNQLLHKTSVQLLGINNQFNLDGKSIVVFDGTISELSLANEYEPTAKLITNVDSQILDKIKSWR